MANPERPGLNMKRTKKDAFELSTDKSAASRGRLEVLQHLLHKRDSRVVVARRVVVGCRHVDGLDDPVVDEHREALAPGVPQDGHWTRMVQHQVERLREFTAGITEEGDDGAV
eukprot:CAMPEP_0175547528 /NCGR_PEP_ID=MMETSP0096-20121207/30340_1 /TAXON_ID=311494 /ORGANISM="Alexandrium monilatum, Strain CCMP3105" /LENGTH=112 /DNA_ID=CAMNT_0016850517 /DNA_START=184 /DNA_END=520 /DNA_ORIENTATION=+